MAPLSTKLPILDALRGFAALWVYAFHCIKTGNDTIDTFIRHGHVGVSVFFVVSGYCIAAAAHGAIERGESPLRFLQRRAVRIFPTFWGSILLIALLAAVPVIINFTLTGEVKYHPKVWMSFSLTKWLSIFSLCEIFRLNSPASFPMRDFASLNAVYWTLAIELQFYVAVAIILKSGIPVIRGVNALALTGLTAAYIPIVTFSGVFLPFWPMFAAGYYVFHLRKQYHLLYAKRRLLGPVWFLCLTAGMVVLEAGWHDRMAFNAIGAYFTVLFLWVYTHLEAVGNVPVRHVHAFLSTRVLGTVGLFSYSLYLTHVPFFVFFNSWFASRQTGTVTFFAVQVIESALVLIGAFSFYLVFERPVLYLLQRTPTGTQAVKDGLS